MTPKIFPCHLSYQKLFWPFIKISFFNLSQKLYLKVMRLINNDPIIQLSIILVLLIPILYASAKHFDIILHCIYRHYFNILITSLLLRLRCYSGVLVRYRKQWWVWRGGSVQVNPVIMDIIMTILLFYNAAFILKSCQLIN